MLFKHYLAKEWAGLGCNKVVRTINEYLRFLERVLKLFEVNDIYVMARICIDLASMYIDVGGF
jgi:hypothetical protein